MLGAVGLRLNWLRGPHVQFLGVLPGFQGDGLGATMLGYAGFEASLDYAKTRPQGRPVVGKGGAAGKDANLPQVRIIEHADVRRMLLQQKCIVEASQLLCLYAAMQVDLAHDPDGDATTTRNAGLMQKIRT